MIFYKNNILVAIRNSTCWPEQILPFIGWNFKNLLKSHLI